jgi:hypothetical protein
VSRIVIRIQIRNVCFYMIHYMKLITIAYIQGTSNCNSGAFVEGKPIAKVCISYVFYYRTRRGTISPKAY